MAVCKIQEGVFAQVAKGGVAKEVKKAACISLWSWYHFHSVSFLLANVVPGMQLVCQDPSRETKCVTTATYPACFGLRPRILSLQILLSYPAAHCSVTAASVANTALPGMSSSPVATAETYKGGNGGTCLTLVLNGHAPAAGEVEIVCQACNS